MDNKLIRLFLVSRVFVALVLCGTTLQARTCTDHMHRVQSTASEVLDTAKEWSVVGVDKIKHGCSAAKRYVGITGSWAVQKWEDSQPLRKRIQRGVSYALATASRTMFNVTHATNCIPHYVRSKDKVTPFFIEKSDEVITVATCDGFIFTLPSWVGELLGGDKGKDEHINLTDVASGTGNALYILLAFVNAACDEADQLDIQSACNALVVDANGFVVSHQQHLDVFSLAKRILDCDSTAADILLTAYAELLIKYAPGVSKKYIAEIDSLWGQVLSLRYAETLAEKYPHTQCNDGDYEYESDSDEEYDDSDTDEEESTLEQGPKGGGPEGK